MIKHGPTGSPITRLQTKVWWVFGCPPAVCPQNGHVHLHIIDPRTILNNFSAVDTQTAVLVSTAEVWISAPDTQTPIFLVVVVVVVFFWLCTADFGCSAGKQKFSVVFVEVPVTKVRVSAPAPCKKPPVTWYSFDGSCRCLPCEESVESGLDPFWQHLSFFDVAPFRWPFSQGTLPY